jgi:Protein of unknown function (DUF3489)
MLRPKSKRLDWSDLVGSRSVSFFSQDRLGGRLAFFGALSDPCGVFNHRRTPMTAKELAQTQRTSRAKNRSSLLAASARPGTKAALILACLMRPKGANLKELVTATGWQPHSIRGFLSGVVAGKMGLKIKSIKHASSDRRYSIKARS